MAMKTANIAEIKNHLSEILALVEAGEEVEVRRRNIPIARRIPSQPPGRTGPALAAAGER
jgi:antitoxin (DNA-binding transcriptional repressor) of toxin-antitoxin stability system